MTDGAHAVRDACSLVVPQVLQVPSEMLFFDKGPLLSAKAHDVKLIVRRLQQIQEVCQSVSSSGLSFCKPFLV